MSAVRHEAAYPDRLVEWLFAVMMAAWGLFLWLPMTTFDNPQYALLAAIAPEQVWGALAISIAAVRATALAINGRWRRTPLFRCACSIVGFNWWCAMIFMIVSTWQAHPPAGLIWYPVFAVFELVSCWRSAADAFHSKALHFPPRPDAR